MSESLDIYEQVDRQATILLSTILESRKSSVSKNETEFRNKITTEISKIANLLNLKLILREEYGLKFGEASGRADAVYNRLIIEYEPPGSLRSEISHTHTAHAIQQIKDYIAGLTQRDKHHKGRLIGIVFDGSFFIFIRWREEHWYIEPPEQVNLSSVRKFLRLFFSLASGRALIPENLVDDFGSQNTSSKKSIKAFYTALMNEDKGLTDMLFKQWQIFFGHVTTINELENNPDGKNELYEFSREIGIEGNGINIPKFFFALHTQYSFIIKLIAKLVLDRYAAGNLGATSLSKLGNQEGENLRAELKNIESGDIFKALGFKNLLEGDFFSWYLYSWNQEIENALKLNISRLAEYDPTTIENDPFAARDLLKKLYHRLLPREVRHDLGEYYTPDWLAEKLFEQLGERIFCPPKVNSSYTYDLNKRILDPACGSGTFPIIAIRSLKAHCARQNISETATLELILNNIVGVDLNPLAVTAARVNYLLALADLLPYRKKEIEIPIYQADSISSPTSQNDLFGQGKIILKTVVGDLPVPSIVNTSDEMNKLAELLEECVISNTSTDIFLNRIKTKLDPTPTESDLGILTELYKTLVNLEQKGLDGIWTKVLKNAFMPLFFGKFDYVIGNPPWINWQSLPDEYRIQTKHLWNEYGLFVHSGMDTILGKGKKDLSTLMTYVAVDKYLKDNGKLAFLITQSVFKTSAGQGFRRFQLGKNGSPFQIVQVDDMNELNPFEGASTKTTLFVLRKGYATKYPVQYLYWRKTIKGERPGYDSTFDEVRAMTKAFQYIAEPVNTEDKTSTWLTGRPLALKAVRKVLGKSDYIAHAGVYSGGANGVFWLELLTKRPDGLNVVKNITEGAKRSVEQITTEIEPDLLYPLLKASDIKRWKIQNLYIYMLMTQDPQKRKGIDLRIMQLQYPKTFTYLKRNENILMKRESQAVKNLMTGGLFYSIFSVGDYTYSKYKVVWPSIASDINAVVIGSHEGKIIMPQHIATFIGTEDIDEAHYLCAVLNSLIVRFSILSYSQVGGKSFGTPHILENIRIGKYESGNVIHRKLCNLSKEAHNHADNLNKIPVIEGQINIEVAGLFGITDSEVNDIKRNYTELFG